LVVDIKSLVSFKAWTFVCASPEGDSTDSTTRQDNTRQQGLVPILLWCGGNSDSDTAVGGFDQKDNITTPRPLPRSQRRFALALGTLDLDGMWLSLNADADAVVDRMELWLWQLWCGISMGARRVENTSENNSNQVRSKSR